MIQLIHLRNLNPLCRCSEVDETIFFSVIEYRIEFVSNECALINLNVKNTIRSDRSACSPQSHGLMNTKSVTCLLSFFA